MNSAMTAGFLSGAGVDPAHMRLILLALAIATLFVVGAWILSQLAQAFANGDLEQGEVMRACIVLCVVISFVISLITWL